MKQTAVEWLIEQMLNQMELRIENTQTGIGLFEQAKEMERQKNIELITWVKENFTSEAPLDYIINEYKKIGGNK
jgi:hypothetical protein